MILLDTNSLVRFLTCKSESDDQYRFEGLLDTARSESMAIGIPTPVLTEFLSRDDDDASTFFEVLANKRAVRVLVFDWKAAIECAALMRRARRGGDKRGGSKDAWQKVKVDQQIVALGMTNGARQIISHDTGLIHLAKAARINAVRIEDLPIPAHRKQGTLAFPPAG